MGIGPFGRTSKFLKVLVGWKEVLIPNGARICLIVSDVPCTVVWIQTGDSWFGSSVGVQGVGLSRLGHALYGFPRVPI